MLIIFNFEKQVVPIKFNYKELNLRINCSFLLMTILLDINEIKWKNINTTVAVNVLQLFSDVWHCIIFYFWADKKIQLKFVIKEICFTCLVKDNSKIKTLMLDRTNQTTTNSSAMKKIMLIHFFSVFQRQSERVSSLPCHVLKW